MPANTRFFDTTLRDGEQTPGVHLFPAQKVKLAAMLEAFGVYTIEAGFPASSPGDMEAVAAISRIVTRCEVAALARCVTSDVDAAVEAMRDARSPVVHVFLGTSDVHLARKLRLTRAEALRRIEHCVAHAAARCAEVEFSAEDATRTDRIFLRQCIETAIGSGATRVNIPDTLGCALPREYGGLIAEVVRFVDGAAIVSAHCHDDMGLATANSVAAVEAGARQVEVTVNGIGERAGNASAEQVAVVLAMKGIAQTGIDLSRAVTVSQMVAEMTGVAVQPNSPIVGANAFAHSSGIHQDGILKEAANYEYVPPALVGVDGHRFVLTARSGRSAVAYKAQSMGFQLGDASLDSVYRRFLSMADRANGPIGDDEFRALVQEVATRAS